MLVEPRGRAAAFSSLRSRSRNSRISLSAGIWPPVYNEGYRAKYAQCEPTKRAATPDSVPLIQNSVPLIIFVSLSGIPLCGILCSTARTDSKNHLLPETFFPNTEACIAA
jgi:hypothetical protein